MADFCGFLYKIIKKTAKSPALLVDKLLYVSGASILIILVLCINKNPRVGDSCLSGVFVALLCNYVCQHLGVCRGADRGAADIAVWAYVVFVRFAINCWQCFAIVCAFVAVFALLFTAVTMAWKICVHVTPLGFI